MTNGTQAAIDALDLIEDQLLNGVKTRGFARPCMHNEKILFKTLTVEMPRHVRKAFFDNIKTFRSALKSKPVDVEDLYSEMDKAFILGKNHDDGLPVDDTQIGIEWAVERLNTPPQSSVTKEEARKFPRMWDLLKRIKAHKTREFGTFTYYDAIDNISEQQIISVEDELRINGRPSPPQSPITQEGKNNEHK